MKRGQITRRDFLGWGLSLGAAGMALGTVACAAVETQTPANKPSVPSKPRYRFSLDPFEVQKEGPVIYSYGTRYAGVERWFGLKGHNFGGCRDYSAKDQPAIARADVRARWEKQNVIPVFMAGADPKAGVEKVRAGWEEAVKQGYRVLSIDEFYAAPNTPVEYDKTLEEFKKQHPDLFIQVWEAAKKFPHMELLCPFIDAYMPEVYWKWFKDDGERRKVFRDLIDRAKKMGALKKLVIGLGTHDVDHLKKTIEDISTILEMEPAIGGFAFFVHRGDIEDEEYHKLHAALDDRLRELFAK